MSPTPLAPKIYHITHVDNLERIVAAGGLVSDSRCLELGLDVTTVGMSSIKRRRLEQLLVTCHPETKVGEYVPFYFCPRSIMLYILHMGNHPELSYRGGQAPILHLEADLAATVAWANENGVRWAFTDRNAGIAYTRFYSQWHDLDRVHWDAVSNNDFRDPQVKEGKQAEFLLYEVFPWHLVERIGVFNRAMQDRVSRMLGGTNRPLVRIEPRWYY